MTRERSLFASVANAAERAANHKTALRWPTGGRYRNDPVGFARDVLGVEPWDRQREILEAIRDCDRVAVSSGHKIGKSSTAAIAGLWFYDSWEDARVVATCVTARQVNAILYREVRKLVAQSGRCVSCRLESEARVASGGQPLPRPCPHSVVISDEPGLLAGTGLVGEGFREFKGYTAKEKEAVAGTSGAHLLYLADEASGIPDEIFEAIEGNRAAGAKIALFSNPTQASGEFFEAFHGRKSAFYKAIRVSSEESPNVVAKKSKIPGLATKAWIDEKRAEWGEDSPLYRIRVKGEHVLDETAKIISVHLIREAEDRYEDTPATGRLSIGIDPAGESGEGDESIFAIRRGQRLLSILSFRGLTADGHVAQLIGIVREHIRARDASPTVVFDELGPIGIRLGRALRAADLGWDVLGVRGSDVGRDPRSYWRMRDELWASLREWLRGGGAIFADDRLSRELNCPAWEILPTGQARATSKDDMRKMLGRSPDRADALALATWERSTVGDQIAAAKPSKIDPYEMSEVHYQPEDGVYGGSSQHDHVYG